MDKKMPDPRHLPQREIDEAFSIARKALDDDGGILEDSPHDYQCFTYKSDDVCLVFYPHRTTAGNYHIRVRNQGSKNKARAEALMDMLNEAAGYNCTFSRK